MTDFAAVKTELHSMSTQAVWDVVRRSNLHTEENVIRYVYAKEELRKRGFVVA